jgi:hypothetical protein
MLDRRRPDSRQALHRSCPIHRSSAPPYRKPTNAPIRRFSSHPLVHETRRSPSRFEASAGYFWFAGTFETGLSIAFPVSGSMDPKSTRFSVARASNMPPRPLVNASQLLVFDTLGGYRWSERFVSGYERTCSPPTSRGWAFASELGPARVFVRRQFRVNLVTRRWQRSSSISRPGLTG